MRYSGHFKTTTHLLLLLLPWAAVIAGREVGPPKTGSYTDIDTGITFHGYVPQSAYRFGMVLPQEPTTDFIAQLVSPLSDKGGWGGIGFASSMIGTLLLATCYAGVVPYTANPITLSPIKRGTYVNSTHITSTFLCGGCINDHSFSPAQSKDSKSGVYLVYAYSQAAVTDPAGIKATLPDHTSQPGGAGASSPWC
ncbi:4e59daff-1a87-49d7-815d-3f2ddb9e9e1f [Thermothielavioides terrestris]|uniref:4e59daff-1a87-49d7-815d-3f2ddb9e9e1f n=1 Tax=Thermothielavioides terrestris TaxID=2587410 RepID=A0A3S4F765_9PEZI|nr:4e59daff-1a87-49d7-815d-3f2ddb9e9e1f [Thermothielavioides terrestris]